MQKKGRILNRAAEEGSKSGIGLGEAMGRVARSRPSIAIILFCAPLASRIPFTAHITIGGDIAHFIKRRWGCVGCNNPYGLSIACTISRAEWRRCLNIGSAIVLPGVLEMRLVRNLGYPLTNIPTANFDFNNLTVR